MVHSYFKRHKDFRPKIDDAPHDDLGITVVLPAYNEPNLWQSLESLMLCHKPECAVEVIIVVNYPANSHYDIERNAQHCIDLIRKADQICNNKRFRFIPLEAFNLTKKHAGVGLARKIGMDQAAWRLQRTQSPTKVIACFDADATCAKNYLTEIEKLWKEHPQTNACSIKYEHPIEGNEFEEKIYDGIAQYELHLRYYMWAGRYIGHPHSYQTVGSSMACSASAYLRFGGMNKNKAGEDFYFLQKIIPHGNFKELYTTTVYPSPRVSDRVPFGTGRAMTKHLEADRSIYFSYNFESFISLKYFLEISPITLFNASSKDISNLLDSLPAPLIEFLIRNSFADAINEINANTSNPKTFHKRFYLWFNAFKLLKYLNFANEFYYEKQPITKEAHTLVRLFGFNANNVTTNTKTLLNTYRQFDRSPPPTTLSNLNSI
ncbi:MAG: glycosyltransferase [Bacteroidales bacterium]